ncbi:MAG: Ig-like domain-containing protein [Gemmatimonas sp.]
MCNTKETPASAAALRTARRRPTFASAALTMAMLALVAAACSETPTGYPDPAPRHSIVITGPATTVYETDTATITAVVRDANGIVSPNAPVVWSVSDTSIASFTENDKLFARKSGSVTITAKSGVLTATHQITIARPAVLKVEVSSSMQVLVRGDVMNINAVLRGPNDRYIKGRAVTGVVDNPAVASLANGRLTALSSGTVTVTVTCEGVSGSITLRVQEPEHDLALRAFNGARLPTFFVGDTLVINGVKEYHELWVESGTVKFTKDPNQYRVRINFYQYRVDSVNGQRTLVPIGPQSEGDRGFYTTDAQGILQMTSRDIVPLIHSSWWSGSDLHMHYNIAGTDESFQLSFRKVPE